MYLEFLAGLAKLQPQVKDKGGWGRARVWGVRRNQETFSRGEGSSYRLARITSRDPREGNKEGGIRAGGRSGREFSFREHFSVALAGGQAAE